MDNWGTFASPFIKDVEGDVTRRGAHWSFRFETRLARGCRQVFRYTAIRI